MKFSTKAEYGLKAMTNLAQCYPEQKTIGEIAKEENISQKYLERLMGLLRNGEVVQSAKGKQGGYTLAKDPKKIPVGEIIELLDGEIFYTLAEAKIIVESWRRHFNTVRPHGSLGYKPPAPEVFVPAMTARAAALSRPAEPTALAPRPTAH